MPESGQGQGETADVVLRAGKIYEECLPLAPTQVIEYSFSASKTVEFNIHYHGDDTVYPVRGDGIVQWSGVFDPAAIRAYSSELPPFFCLMWTNPHEEEVELRFDIRVRERE